jgi:signal peptidase I
LRRLIRSWRQRVAVAGHSMEPTLRTGDWLLVDPDAYRGRAPVAGDLVVTPDPREPARLLVKRVVDIGPDGHVALAGDNPAHRHRPDHVQPDQILVPPTQVIGRPWFRYWPPRRIGRVD